MRKALYDHPDKLLFLLILPLFWSCDEGKLKDISKDGSVETAISISHIDSKRDLIKTTHKIWVAGKLNTVYTHNDTIPSLGYSNQVGENVEGVQKTVNIPKEYELYITVN